MNKELTIIQCVNDLNLSSGGPSKTVTSLSSYLSKRGLDVKICSSMSNSFDYLSANLNPNNEIAFLNFNKSKGIKYRPLINSYLLNKLQNNFKNNQRIILHDNGIWLPFNNTISLFSKVSSIPLIISPHGMLEPWSLKYNYFKKRLAWYLYQKKALKTACLFHATSFKEADNLSRLNLKLPIVVIPNGVEQPRKNKLKKKIGLENFNLIKKNEKIFLYLGRIHPKKGLMNLLKAWSSIFRNNNNFKLIIAGYPELNYLDELKKFVNKEGLNKNIIFLGPVEGEDLITLYKNSYIFVLPTFSENFGIVVAEALSYGLPVITTTGTPWEILEDENCGWYIEPNVDDLMKSLKEASNLDNDNYEIKSKNAINLSKSYNWEKISKSFLDIYLWILGDKCEPPNIYK